ncbi:Glycine--tRNA ligase beta subunit (fragment) [Erythrobacter sp. EC-HK427]
MGGATPDTSNPHPQPLPQGEGASLADLAYEAAKLCKADLVTEMVGEFPELQGLMGGYYARAEGLDPQVADAIRDHYKPVGQGDDVPTAPVTVAVSLADKLDTLLSFFAVDELPTGSKDPFALRRAALGIARTIIFNAIPFNLGGLQSRWDCEFDPDKRGWIKTQAGLGISETILGKPNPHDLEALFYGLSPAEFMEVLSDTNWREEVVSNERRTLDFFAERLKVQQREAGVRHDLIDAVFALGGEDDLVRLLARVHALQAFVETGDGVNLLAGYKRAANILKKENHPLVTPAQAGAQLDSGLRRNDDMMSTGDEDPLENVDDPEMRAIYAEQIAQSGSGLSYTPEAAEKALINALDAAEPLAAEAIAKEDFAAAMSALASLRAPIDAFFEEVTVNDADQAKRKSRLALLARFRAAVHNVADFSKIEG